MTAESKPHIIAITFTGNTNTYDNHSAELGAFGLSDSYASVHSIITDSSDDARGRHEMACSKIQELREANPKARFLVLDTNMAPLVGATPLPEGTLKINAASRLNADVIGGAIQRLKRMEFTPQTKKAPSPLSAQPSSNKPALSLIDKILSASQENSTGRGAKLPAKPKPKILVIYSEPCNGEGIVKIAGADITHTMLVPESWECGEYIDRETHRLNMKALGQAQSRKAGKPTFLKEAGQVFGERFWGDKKFDAAISTHQDLEHMLSQGDFDGVMVVGNHTDRREYSLLPETIPGIIENLTPPKAPITLRAEQAANEDIVVAAKRTLTELKRACLQQLAPQRETPPADNLQTSTDPLNEGKGWQRKIYPKPRTIKPIRQTTDDGNKGNHLVILHPGLSGADLLDIKQRLRGECTFALLGDEHTIDVFTHFTNAKGGIIRPKGDGSEPAITRLLREKFGAHHALITHFFANKPHVTGCMIGRQPHAHSKDHRHFTDVIVVGGGSDRISVDFVEGVASAHTGHHAACKFQKFDSLSALNEAFPALQPQERAM